jgi:hypothetical protein
MTGPGDRRPAFRVSSLNPDPLNGGFSAEIIGHQLPHIASATSEHGLG